MADKRVDSRDEILGQERVLQQDMRRCVPIIRRMRLISSALWMTPVTVWIMRAAGCMMNIRINT